MWATAAAEVAAAAPLAAAGGQRGAAGRHTARAARCRRRAPFQSRVPLTANTHTRRPGTYAGARSQTTQAGPLAALRAAPPPAAPSPPCQSAWRAPQTPLLAGGAASGGKLIRRLGGKGRWHDRRSKRGGPEVGEGRALQQLLWTARLPIHSHPSSSTHATSHGCAAHQRCRARRRWRRTRRGAWTACVRRCAQQTRRRGSSAQSLLWGEGRRPGRSMSKQVRKQAGWVRCATHRQQQQRRLGHEGHRTAAVMVVAAAAARTVDVRGDVDGCAADARGAAPCLDPVTLH